MLLWPKWCNCPLPPRECSLCPLEHILLDFAFHCLFLAPRCTTHYWLLLYDLFHSLLHPFSLSLPLSPDVKWFLQMKVHPSLAKYRVFVSVWGCFTWNFAMHSTEATKRMMSPWVAVCVDVTFGVCLTCFYGYTLLYPLSLSLSLSLTHPPFSLFCCSLSLVRWKIILLVQRAFAKREKETQIPL